MELLTAIRRDTIEPEYGTHYADETPKKARTRWLVLAIGFLAGLMFATSSMGGAFRNDSVASERADLIAQAEQAEERNEQLRAEADGLAAEVEALQANQLGRQIVLDDSAVSWSGIAAVSGPGIVLTITDNPRDDSGIVVDQDIRHIVNGLWLAGAEAISVNGHRLSARTAIRQAGSAITVNYRSLTSPYHIEAIGDPESLSRSFSSGPGAAWLNYLKRNHGVSWTMDSRRELNLGADPGLDVDNASVR